MQQQSFSSGSDRERWVCSRSSSRCSKQIYSPRVFKPAVGRSSMQHLSQFHSQRLLHYSSKAILARKTQRSKLEGCLRRVETKSRSTGADRLSRSLVQTKKHQSVGMQNSIYINVDHGFISRYAATPANIAFCLGAPRKIRSALALRRQ